MTFRSDRCTTQTQQERKRRRKQQQLVEKQGWVGCFVLHSPVLLTESRHSTGVLKSEVALASGRAGGKDGW